MKISHICFYTYVMTGISKNNGKLQKHQAAAGAALKLVQAQKMLIPHLSKTQKDKRKRNSQDEPRASAGKRRLPGGVKRKFFFVTVVCEGISRLPRSEISVSLQ